MQPVAIGTPKARQTGRQYPRQAVSLSEVESPLDLGYSIAVQRTETSTPDFPAEKLALAQQAFREFHARCFWFMRRDAEIVVSEVPYICERLRADGGRRGFQIAAEICH